MLHRLVVGGGWFVGFVSVLVAASLVVNQYFTPHYKQQSFKLVALPQNNFKTCPIAESYMQKIALINLDNATFSHVFLSRVPADCIQVNPRKRAFGYDEYWEIIDKPCSDHKESVTDDSHLKATTFIHATRIHHPPSEDRINIQQPECHTRPYHGREQLVY